MACSLWINLFGILVSLISQPCLTRFQWNLCYPLSYAYSTSIAIFRLTLLLDITAEHTLHSRVKDSITQNQDCCFFKNYRITVYINVLIFSWNFKKIVGLSFSEFCFKHFVHFLCAILSNSFPTATLNQVHVELISSMFYIC